MTASLPHAPLARRAVACALLLLAPGCTRQIVSSTAYVTFRDTSAIVVRAVGNAGTTPPDDHGTVLGTLPPAPAEAPSAAAVVRAVRDADGHPVLRWETPSGRRLAYDHALLDRDGTLPITEPPIEDFASPLAVRSPRMRLEGCTWLEAPTGRPVTVPATETWAPRAMHDLSLTAPCVVRPPGRPHVDFEVLTPRANVARAQRTVFRGIAWGSVALIVIGSVSMITGAGLLATGDSCDNSHDLVCIPPRAFGILYLAGGAAFLLPGILTVWPNSTTADLPIH